MGFDLSLSASKLNLMKKCERCFYDANTLDIPQPRGIFPSLPGGIDRVMKTYLDVFGGTVPPMLAGHIPGQLYPDRAQMNKWRNWKSGLKAEVEVHGVRVGIIGALDDLLMNCPDYSPLDGKTKGSEPKDDGAVYYQVQSDVYGLLLDRNKMRVSGKSYFVYFHPAAMVGCDIAFGITVHALRCSPDHAVETIGKAVLLLKGGQPDWNRDCEYCVFAQARVEAAVKTIARPMAIAQ